ncbi:MAG: CHASE2 domain-containing protein, partial [Verrucomicrobiota bacterium]
MNWNAPELRQNFIYRALICLGFGLIAAVFILFSFFQKIDSTLVNQLIQLRNAIHTPSPAENLMTIVVDQPSITPGTSIFASEWNQGGWLTRNNWIVSLDLFKDFHKPRVIALDVGLSESATVTSISPHPMIPPDSFERVRRLQDLIQSGNLDLQKKFWELTERRQLGMDAPLPVLGVDLIPNGKIERPITQAAARDLLLKTVVQSCKIPEGCVHGKFKNAPISMDRLEMRLPPQEILASPLLIGFNLPTDDPEKIPLLFPILLQQNPDQIVYVPTFVLVTFLASKDISIKGVAPFGAGSPSLQVVPGRFIQIQKGSEIIEIPIDNTGSMRVNPRRTLSEVAPTPFTAFIEDGLIASQRTYDNRGSGLQSKTIFVTRTYNREELEKSEFEWTALDMLFRQDFLKKLDPFFQGMICITVSLMALFFCTAIPEQWHTLGFVVLSIIYLDA